MLRVGYCWAPAFAARTRNSPAPRTRMVDIGQVSRRSLIIARDGVGGIALEEFGQALTHVLVADGLDMAASRDDPHVFGFAGALVQPLRMVQRHDHVVLAVDEKHRDRRKRL